MLARHATRQHLPLEGLAGQPRLAFGFDPTRSQSYSLRQSRYEALAADIGAAARDAARAGRRLRVIDVGCGTGILGLYLRRTANFANIELAGTDLRDDIAFARDAYRDFFAGDLTEGYGQIASGAYDYVVCEQVLEHLPSLAGPVATLQRLARPGGRVAIGVPIFVTPLVAVRRYLVPLLDRIVDPDRSRGHLQFFSLRSLRATVERQPGLRLRKLRGFRIVSGGPLRPLENFRWWWRLNRRLGELAPGLCIEVQAILDKVPDAES